MPRRMIVQSGGRRCGKTAAARESKTLAAATRKARRAAEDAEQKGLASWCEHLAMMVPALLQSFHVPNGGVRPSKIDAKGKRYSFEGAKLKSMGAKPGVFDFFLDLPRGYAFGGAWCKGELPAHGLRIELKVGDNDLSNEQRAWRARWVQYGYAVHVCYSWPEAAHRIADYLAPRNGSLPCVFISRREADIIRGALPPLPLGGSHV